MASHTGTAVALPTPVGIGWRLARRWMATGAPLLPASTTIYYRTANGSTRGTTTSAAGVPAGSVVERITR